MLVQACREVHARALPQLAQPAQDQDTEIPHAARKRLAIVGLDQEVPVIPHSAYMTMRP